MKYTILGFQQDKLIENNLSVEDAFILRTIKDMYSSASMEFKDFEGIKYMWINYSYLLEQIPIIGSKRNLMRRIEFYGKECLLLRILEKERNGVKGNYSYISPMEKLDLLQDFDLMTKSHKVVTESHKPYDKNDTSLMTESHNKDTSIKDTSIKDKNIFLSDSNEYRLADYLRKYILKNNPSARVPDDNKIQGWCKTIDLMIRRDNRNVDDIRAHIKFAQTDTFWLSNVLSASSLREKYDKLTMKMKTVQSVKPKDIEKPASYKVVNEGCCPTCKGKGVVRQENEWVECPECKGGKKVG